MRDFLLLFEGGDPSWAENASPEDIKGVMDQWGAWFQELEASGNLRNPGAALAPGGAVLRTKGDAIEMDQSLPEVKELIGGFTIIAADSIEQASRLAEGGPFLKNNPTGSVTVRPVMQM